MAFGKFGKYYPGGVEFVPENADLRAVVQREFERFRETSGQGERLQFQPGEGEIPVRTDIKHLSYIVINLLQNALKYSAPGQNVKMTLNTQHNHAVLSVTDHGIGIPDSELSDLFSPFYRATNVADRPGTGMGLAIVKKSARMIGAEIRVESRLGHGTQFEVLIPL